MQIRPLLTTLKLLIQHTLLRKYSASVSDTANNLKLDLQLHDLTQQTFYKTILLNSSVVSPLLDFIAISQ